MEKTKKDGMARGESEKPLKACCFFSSQPGIALPILLSASAVEPSSAYLFLPSETLAAAAFSSFKGLFATQQKHD